MVILIIGGSGQLGRALREVLQEEDREILCTYNSTPVPEGVKLNLLDHLDVENLILKTKPDIIINTAAFTNVDECEVKKDFAYKINGESVRYIVRAARIVGSYYIHISTDYVFDGEKGLYKEEDTPSPINYYGLSKLIGESYALSYDNSLVVRTSGIFGYIKNFPLVALNKLIKGEPVYAIDNYYSPIHAKILALAIKEILYKYVTGIIHIAGERVSRYELALKLAEKLNVDKSLIKKVSCESSQFLAKRPKDSSLDVSKAKRLIKFNFYSLDDNLNLLIKEHSNRN